MAVRNWRVHTRLNAILLIPVLVALVFGGIRVQESIETWNEAKDARHIAELVEAAADYSHALTNERDRSAEPLLRGDPDDPEVEEVRDATDRAKRAFDARIKGAPDKPALQRRLAAFKKAEQGLPTLRQAAYTDRLSGAQTEEGYVQVQHPLMEFANDLGLGTGNVTAYGRAVYAISLAKSAESLQRSLGMHLLLKPGPSEKSKKQQLTALASYAYLENIALEEYRSGGRPEDVELLKSQLAGVQAESVRETAAAKAEAESEDRPFVAPPAMDKMVTAIAGGSRASTLKDRGITPESYFSAATAEFDAYRAVEKRLAGDAVKETEQISADAKRDAFVNGGAVLAALLLAFLVAGMMARSMGRSMRVLRNAAFGVAEQRLPMLVDQLSRTEPGRVDTRVEPIPLDSRDEIGEVARAFDQVHREAVRLAAEQALLRGNVNAIFTNLSSRNQGLIERQLELITSLENNEAEPEQLESLFRLDHLATRMRRNGENLLVLAGEEAGRRWNEPVPLVDVLRAASSEVEHYNRIELSGVPESEIHGAAVTDLVHLLAELLENATSFSSPHTKVEITATRLPDGRVMIEIHDKGIGLTSEDFADINHKLANPPTVDASISQRMGLFVVGRLANRHSIRVQLRPSGAAAGTTSLVMLPEVITRGGGGEAEEAPAEDFTVSPIVTEQPGTTVQPYAAPPVVDSSLPSAAELGFDDASYRPAEPGSAPSAFDSVNRSVQREERRAAVEARQQNFGEQTPPGHAGHGQTGYQAEHPQQPEHLQAGHSQAGHPQAGDPQAGHPQIGYQQNQYPQNEYGASGYEPTGYGRTGYDQEGYVQGGYGQTSSDQSGNDHAGPGRPDQPLHSDPGYGLQQSPYGQQQPDQPEAESVEGISDPTGNHVGFERPGPSPSTFRSTTGAGLPRRDPGWQQWEEGPEAQQQPQTESPDQQSQESLPAPPDHSENAHSEWTSVNDDRRDRAGRLREPEAGGVTESGLPRRVPRANLVEGTAEQDPQGGPHISRSPEDVRGRLSNLHRGVRRGRTTGDTTQNDRQGFGPGSTYDQER
ncbi:nitrate- and nitrite sensing domain-containing protein [Streptomyces sp. N2-109]|uniref:histidine kinase n=2 Tax=Streptomyces gossypii TaxID=2883101 RepID=A0ABT2JZG7_9ACTN|nr:nitrate- and nitrite sensing domain-containing protein [Streptomyces gossypii]MCT2592629.1 nitrate- and nitrite sensing domain-containing protein [Streptomyces gossypii]